VLYVLPKWEQQSVVLQATRAKVMAGLLHQHRPGLRSFHDVAAKDSYRPDPPFHAAVVARGRWKSYLESVAGKEGAAAVVVISGKEGRGEETLSVNNVDNGGRCGKRHTRRTVAGDRLM
jgi:hypothetical protein